MSFFYLIPLGLIALFIYLQIGRMISAACWNYWDRQFHDRYKWNLSDWRARPKSRNERVAVFLLYPVTYVSKSSDDSPPIESFLFNNRPDAPDKPERMKIYLLSSAWLWPYRPVWALVIAMFLMLRACAFGLAATAKYMMLARAERLPVLAARRLWAMRLRRATRTMAPSANENFVALVDEHRSLDERIVPLQARRREIESHPDFEKARALRARR